MAAQESNVKPLRDLLAEVLPKDTSFKVYHLSSPPTICGPLFAAPPGSRPDRTYCESHSLAVSITSKKDGEAEELLVFAIEILIYTTKHLTTLFVSKADSTGYLSELAIPRSQGSPLKAVATTFISFLVEHRQRPRKRLVLSLFARAQDQYIFPASIDNKTKHVLDDRGLIKWWCRVLDPIMRKYAPEKSEPEGDETQTTSRGFLTVPGLEKYETMRFFPASTQNDSPSQKRWVHGHPLREINSVPTAPPRCLIPRFPDDPKARYLDELDDEVPELASQPTSTPTRGSGRWRSIKTLEQFWEMMAFRQECSSGRLVGFIWVVFTPPGIDDEDDGADEGAESQPLTLASMVAETASTTARSSKGSQLRGFKSSKKSRRRKVLSGPISPRMPRIKSAASTQSISSQPDETRYYAWPTSSRGELVMSEKEYKRAHELLLQQNFASRTAAAASSRRWIAEVGVLAGTTQGWGYLVTGEKEAKTGSTNNDSGNSAGVHVLTVTAVRKKRPVEAVEPTSGGTATMLGAGLVRKKPKQEEAVVAGGTAAGEPNVLDAGLVRKKVKTEKEGMESKKGG